MRQQPNPQVRCKVFLVCGMMSDEHEKGIPNKTVDTHCAGPFVQPPPTHTHTHTFQPSLKESKNVSIECIHIHGFNNSLHKNSNPYA